MRRPGSGRSPDLILLTGAVGGPESGGVTAMIEAIRRHLDHPDVPIQVVHPNFSILDLTFALIA